MRPMNVSPQSSLFISNSECIESSWTEFLRSAMLSRLFSKFTSGMSDGIAPEVSSREVQWVVDLPATLTHWEHWSSFFILRDMKYKFNLYPGGLYSDNIYLAFFLEVPATARFPLHLRWQMGAKRGDGDGLERMMEGEREVAEEFSRSVQQVKVKRAELERLLSADGRLTFVHRLDVGEAGTNPQDYTQRSTRDDETNGVAREVSKGVYWEVDLPPEQTHWDYWSPDFTFGKIHYRFNLYPGGLNSDGVYLRFVVKVPGTAVFPLHLRWRMAVKRGDAAGFRWIMNGERVVEGECHRHVQQVRILRVELESALSLSGRLTFFHRLDVGVIDTNSHISTQTKRQCLNKTQVSRETQTEQKSAAAKEEKHSSWDTKEFEEFRQHFRLWLKHPEEGDRIRRLRREKLEANGGKSIWRLPEEDKGPLIFAA